MGWTYNTEDPDAPTSGPLITGVATALTILSLITVCLRTYVRAVLIRAFGIDDWIIIVTWVAAAGFAIITIIQTKWGLGLRHIDDLPPEDVYNFGLLQYMGAPFYITSILGFKLALLCSYLRFVPIGAYRITIFAVIAACVAFHLSFLLVQINLCQPARKQWDPSVTYGSCLPGVPFYTSMASITIVFDVTVMLLPFPVLLQSRIQTRKKLILLGLFGLGLFITIIQIIRIQTVKQLANYIDSAPLILWSAVENNLGIIVANVPTLAPLVKYYNERSSRGNGTSGRSASYGYHRSGRSGTAHNNNDVTSNSRSNTYTGAAGTGGIGKGRGAGGRAGESKIGSRYASRSADDETELGSFDGVMAISAAAGAGKGTGSTESILEVAATPPARSGSSRSRRSRSRSSSRSSIRGATRGGDRRHHRDGDRDRERPGEAVSGITKKVEVVITRS